MSSGADSATASDARASYFEVIVRAIATLKENNGRTRREAYERAAEMQQEYLASVDPALSTEEIDYEVKLLRYTIRAIENDIRDGIDIFATGYAPRDLAETREKLLTARNALIARRKAEEEREARMSGALRGYGVMPGEVTDDDARIIRRMRAGVLALDHRSGGGQASRPAGFGGIIIALIRLQLRAIAAESRLAIFWLLIQPAVLLGVIVTLYLFVGTHSILNMDVATFALLGAATWIMFRQVAARASGAYSGNRSLINLPPVSPLHVAVAQGVLYALIYLFVLLLLLGIGNYAGVMSAPDDAVGATLMFAMMWLFALFVGITFGCAAAWWPFARRLEGVVLRLMQLFSSIYFVTEQLPEEYKGYILWAPTAHGMQLLRAQYFHAYASQDASMSYFLLCLVGLAVVSLGLERLARPLITPS